jgi:uncharacterized phage protein (TIGR01671 family)
MREIKFRGKRKNGSDIFIGDLVRTCNGAIHVFPHEKDLGYNSPDYYEVDPETIGQATGITDTTNTEIFELDIVTVEYGIGKVIFHNGCFMIEWIDDPEANMELLGFENYKQGRPRKDLKIIGNTFTK